MLRIGILGYGYMGTIRHVALTSRTDCDVVRIFHTERGPKNRAASWQEVVDDPSIDAIFVCLPNHLTAPAVCRALRNGKHVFAEKPAGRSLAEVEAMIAAEAASSRVLKFGFNHRYHPAIRAARARIATGELGEIAWLRGRYGKPIPEDFASSWRADFAQAGGGILIDQGIHMLDLFQMLCGDFEEVHAVSATAPERAVEDDVFVVLRNARGQLASLHSSHTQKKPLFSLEVGLTRGELSVDGLLTRTGRYGPERLEWRTDDGEVHEETFTHDDSWAMEIDSFFRAIREGTPVEVGSTRDARRIMALVDAIYAAAKTSAGAANG
jgi:1,5-anhydro-D-fructose reductase (1,5-anhydro-D-mannitol-forming)